MSSSAPPTRKSLLPPRAGGVSPPWFCKPHVQRKRLEFRVSGSHAECVPRAASTPAPGAVTTTVRRKKDDLCDAQTHFHRSGDRQPTVGVSIVGAVAFVSHGWLTPAAPGARRSFAGKSSLAMRSRTRTKSGGRQPAVALGNAFARAIAHTHVTTVSPTKSGGRQPAVGLVGAGFSVVYRGLTCSRVSGTTAGLRQPLLLHDVRPPGNHFLQSGVEPVPRAASVSPNKSGGRKPPVG
jgi:hypothetical protein